MSKEQNLENKEKALHIGDVSKRFTLEEAQEIFFAGYFHYPMNELDEKKDDVNGFNKHFLAVIKRSYS